jgi:Xaa-Pro aminopeptidase
MSDRAERLVGLLDDAGVDALLVSERINVRYLTGFTGTNGIVVIGPRLRAFFTDFRYVEQAAEEVDPQFERRRASLDLIEAVAEALGGAELRLGFEEEHVSVRQHTRLRELLPESVELVAVGGLPERLRAVKDRHEVAHIKAATELADAVFSELISGGLVGRSERELAIALETRMREQGAQRPSFETIVATGPHGALPHAQPRDVRIRPGELVVIDWGAQLDGYCSDCTRTLAAGEPADEAREVYELVLGAQRTGVEGVRAGAGAREVDGLARAVIDAGGYGERFGHGLGHGVGLDVHEGPRLSQRSDDQLQAGNVVTVEPGVYLPGLLGVRIEDLVVVSEDGGEVLTSIGKQLTVTD